MLNSVRTCQWFVFIGLPCEKPNFVLDKKEDISNNSWNGLTCELVRFLSLEAVEKLSDLLVRSFKDIVHVKLSFKVQGFKLKKINFLRT